MFAKYTRSFKCDFSERASVNALSAKKTARCFNLNYDMNSVAASHRLDIAELEGAIRAPLNDSLDGPFSTEPNTCASNSVKMVLPFDPGP